MIRSRRSPCANHIVGFLAGVAVSLLVVGFTNYCSRQSHIVKMEVTRSRIGNFHDNVPLEHDESEDIELRREMHDSVRVLCWIMTSPNNTHNRAVQVNATWAPRCNKHIFLSTDPESGLPTADLNITDGRKFLWGKTKAALKYLYENELDNYDWFLKADDDTYVVVENLRFMLMAYSPKDPLYFGCKFKPFVDQGYMSGGAGYVLSREALKRFVEVALSDKDKCKQADTGAEDAEIGKCMKNIGAKAVDTRDYLGRHRMLPFSPMSHMDMNNKSVPEWFRKYMYYPYNQGNVDCCSNYMISFHYINHGMMYALDYFIYKLKLFGSHHEHFQHFGKPGDSIFSRAEKFAQAYSQLNDTTLHSLLTMQQPGFVTTDFLERCAKRNIELFEYNGDAEGGKKRKPRLLARPPTDRCAVALEYITRVPFVVARTRPQCDEDHMWRARFDPEVAPVEDEIQHPVYQGEVQVFTLGVEEDIGADVEEVEDLAEDLLFIKEQLEEDDLLNKDEELINPDEVRELMEDARRQQESGLMYGRREVYIIDSRRRIANTYLFDEHGNRRVPVESDNTETPSHTASSREHISGATDRSFELSTALDHSFEISTVTPVHVSSGDSDSIREVEISDDDSFGSHPFMVPDDESFEEDQTAEMPHEDTAFTEFLSWCDTSL